jgi:hypothetical protein
MGDMTNQVEEKMVALGYAGEWLGAGNAYVLRSDEDIEGLEEHFAEEVAASGEEFPSAVREIVVSNMDCDDLPTSMDEQVMVEISDGEGEEILAFETTLPRVMAFRAV